MLKKAIVGFFDYTAERNCNTQAKVVNPAEASSRDATANADGNQYLDFQNFMIDTTRVALFLNERRAGKGWEKMNARQGK